MTSCCCLVSNIIIKCTMFKTFMFKSTSSAQITINFIVFLIICSMTKSTQITNNMDQQRILLQSTLKYDNWITGNSSLPRSDRAMAVGYNNKSDTIWLLGGVNNNNQLISFHEDEFTDHGINNLTNYVYGYGQFYSQIFNVLWMINPSGDQLDRFNLETLQFESSYYIPVDVSTSGCLTSIIQGTNSYIFVIGGGTNDQYLYLLQIFNVTSMKWFNITNTPKMHQGRVALTCNAHNDKLYAIGGRNDSFTSLSSIEVLFIGDNLLNITNDEWKYIDPLTKSLFGLRSIKYGDDIIIIGGYSPDENEWSNLIHVIDSQTNMVSIGGYMSFEDMYSSSIMVDQIVFAFGGMNAGGNLNKWQYMDLTATPNTSEISTFYILIGCAVCALLIVFVIFIIKKKKK
eukprot:102039_1